MNMIPGHKRASLFILTASATGKVGVARFDPDGRVHMWRANNIMSPLVGAGFATKTGDDTGRSPTNPADYLSAAKEQGLHPAVVSIEEAILGLVTYSNMAPALLGASIVDRVDGPHIITIDNAEDIVAGVRKRYSSAVFPTTKRAEPAQSPADDGDQGQVPQPVPPTPAASSAPSNHGGIRHFTVMQGCRTGDVQWYMPDATGDGGTYGSVRLDPNGTRIVKSLGSVTAKGVERIVSDGYWKEIPGI